MEETKLGKFLIQYENSVEYHTIKREVWGQDTYYFETEKEVPFIIDIGSHIGISILYFKSIYPNSKIIGFEPNPNSFNLLQENIAINKIDDVQVVNKAIWKENGKKSLFIDSNDSNWHSNSSFLQNSWTGKESTTGIKVDTTRLDPYIDGDIDMLKIDTEGSEISILKSHKSILNKVNNIVVEYHPVKDTNPQELIDILNPYFDIEVLEEGKFLKKAVKGKLLTIKGKKRK